MMVHCHDMRAGQVYVCEECGLELQVAKNCTENGKHLKGVSCTRCTFVCCNKDMKLREQVYSRRLCENSKDMQLLLCSCNRRPTDPYKMKFSTTVAVDANERHYYCGGQPISLNGVVHAQTQLCIGYIFRPLQKTLRVANHISWSREWMEWRERMSVLPQNRTQHRIPRSSRSRRLGKSGGVGGRILQRVSETPRQHSTS